MLYLVPFWIAGAILIGFLGRNQRFGFWGYFFASIMLTPIIGLLILIAATPTRDARRAMRRGQ
jgi:hypothetical protein